MTLTHGADADVLRQIAEKVMQHEGELAGLRDQGNAQVGVLQGAWEGPDLESFTREWSLAQRSIESCTASLRAMATVMREQASQQSDASRGVSGFGGGAPTGPSGPPSPPPEPAPSESTFDEDIRGTEGKPEDKDLWALAHHSYGPNNSLYSDPLMGSEQPELPEGYSEVSDEEIRALGLDPSQFTHGRSGLQSVLYQTPDGGYVLAYRGSDEGVDWAHNGLQGVGLPSAQYTHAMELATQVNEATGGNVTFTGHSLGGGLAAAAGMATGQPAVTFDAAGVHENTAEQAAQIRGEGATAESVMAEANQGQMRTYHLETDILTNVQENSPLAAAAPDAPGTAIQLETPQSEQRDAVREHGGDIGADAGGFIGGVAGAVVGLTDGDPFDVVDDIQDGAAVGAGVGQDLGTAAADQIYGHHWNPMGEAMEERYPE